MATRRTSRAKDEDEAGGAEPSATTTVQPAEPATDIREDGTIFTVTCTVCGDVQRFVDKDQAQEGAGAHLATVHAPPEKSDDDA